MTTQVDPQAAARPHAAALWSELHEATERCFDDYLGADAGQRASAQARLLLALELGWKMEEQVLVPALHDGDVRIRSDANVISDEIELLRELADLVQGGGVDPAASLIIVGALEGIASLRAARIEQALETARGAKDLDATALAQEMQSLIDRWRKEIATTGDIEDEEADPVGKPPR